MIEQTFPWAPPHAAPFRATTSVRFDHSRRLAFAQEQHELRGQWDALLRAIEHVEIRRAADCASRIAALQLAHAVSAQAFLRDALAGSLAPGSAFALHVARMAESASALGDALDGLREDLLRAGGDALALLRLRRSAWHYADAWREGARMRERMLLAADAPARFGHGA